MSSHLLVWLYWIIIFCYCFCVSLGMWLIGVNWYKFETKFKRPPQRLLIMLYVANFFIMYYGFQLPFLIQFVFNVFLMASVWFGTQFQCIGLTGGIATGKSTVSTILAENGFDIIDLDKINHEVSY